MKNFTRIIAFILVAIMMLSMLAACNSTDTDADDDDDEENVETTEETGTSATPEDTNGETEPSATEKPGESATEPDATEPGATEPDATEPDATEPEATEPEATEPEKPEYLLKVDAKYVIIRPESCSDAVQTAAIELREALSALIGESVSIKEDYLYGDSQPDQYEILIGETNREESITALAGIKYYDYTVEAIGDKLVIVAYTDEQIVEAVEYVKGLIENASGSLEFKEEDQKTVRAEYKFDQIKFGETSLAGYSIIIPAKANGIIKSYADKLQQKVLESSGILLPIKTDSKAETEKEILLGNTSRDASKAIKQAALSTNGYVIAENGSKIVIKSKDDEFTFVKTIKNIMDEMESGAFSASEGKITISKDVILTSFMFSDVHNNFAMLEPTNRNGGYIVRKNVDTAIDTLLETVGPVDVVLVGGDLMSDYHSWNSSGCWPYKYFVEYRELLVKTFKRLSKDGKVSYVAGNHDYGQGELATDAPHTPTGNYNSCDFYFGDVGMRQDWGELPEEDMFWVVGEKTGDKYLLAYVYEVNGVYFVGISADHDEIWSVQGSGFNDECLVWLDKKLDEIDPYGNELIIVNCHYFFDHRTAINADGSNKYANVESDRQDLAPVYKGHKNLYHIFGHGEVWFSDTTARYVSHHNMAGQVIDVTGKESSSSEIISYDLRSFTMIYGGHFRPDANAYPSWFMKDYVYGFAGTSTPLFTHRSTCTPKIAQGLYIEVYENKVVFTMKNFGTVEGFTTNDLIEPYTAWLYK